MPNATAIKFGYPQSCVAETDEWLVLVRPKQPALGSLVLVSKQPVQAFGALSPAGFAALQPVIEGIERVLKALVDYQRINYLMLMMVDPDVHFHVIPRYQGQRQLGSLVIADAGWPGPPALDVAHALSQSEQDRLVAALRALWLRAPS